MKEKLRNLFVGRQGMDELSKFLFWWGLAAFAFSVLAAAFLGRVLGSIFSWLGLLLLILSFFRAFSRRIGQREAENALYLAWVQKRARENAARRDRFHQRKDFAFFKCPGCGAMIRVPRGKGKIHISCRCGYQLYRKT